MVTVGQQIARFRKEKGMTQEVLATAIGVSSQAISKWENNTNLPDILLLPVLADVFGVRVDDLFGRKQTKELGNPEQAVALCCDSLLETVFSCMHRSEEEQVEQALKQYKKALHTNPVNRTGIIRKQGVVYYREEIGGLILKKPTRHWHDLLSLKQKDMEILRLLADENFRCALKAIVEQEKTVFTVASLCNSCGMKEEERLAEILQQSNLFTVRSVDIDGKTVDIYELTQAHKLFLLFAILIYAFEYSGYEMAYTGYSCDGNYFFA